MAKFTKDMFVINKLDPINLTKDWELLTTASIFKEEYQDKEAEKEIILSYANALNCINNALISQNHSEITIMTFRTNSLAIPFIFLARHTVELVFKFLFNIIQIAFK